MDDTTLPDARPAPLPRVGLLVAAALVAVVAALVPLGSLRALAAPIGLGIAVALLIFPGLPTLWHLLAERRRASAVGPGRPLDRLALRSLTVALLVLGVSLANLGPRKVGAALTDVVGWRRATPAPAPLPVLSGPRQHELESFIPADATLVVAMADAALVQRFLGDGGDTHDKLAALAKCQIGAAQTRLLLARRGAHERMIVVRAPGITDPRNLYCLVGVLGAERLKLRFVRDTSPIAFEVTGLVPEGSLTFTAADGETLVMTDSSWGEAAQQKLLPPVADKPPGVLLPVLARLDRGASLWAASRSQTERGAWDLALDARLEGEALSVRASAVPPAGEGERAEATLRMPLGFATALPAGAFARGVEGVAAAFAATATQPIEIAPSEAGKSAAPAGKAEAAPGKAEASGKAPAPPPQK